MHYVVLCSGLEHTAKMEEKLSQDDCQLYCQKTPVSVLASFYQCQLSCWWCLCVSVFLRVCVCLCCCFFCWCVFFCMCFCACVCVLVFVFCLRVCVCLWTFVLVCLCVCLYEGVVLIPHST